MITPLKITIDGNTFTGNMSDMYRSKYFSFEGIVSEANALEIQRQAGYEPNGYGFYSYTAKTHKDGTTRTTWNCGRSCD